MLIGVDGNTITQTTNSNTVAGNCVFDVYAYDSSYNIPTNVATGGSFGSVALGRTCNDFDLKFKLITAQNFNNPTYIGPSIYTLDGNNKPYCAFTLPNELCSGENFINSPGTTVFMDINNNTISQTTGSIDS